MKDRPRFVVRSVCDSRAERERVFLTLSEAECSAREFEIIEVQYGYTKEAADPAPGQGDRESSRWPWQRYQGRNAGRWGTAY